MCRAVPVLAAMLLLSTNAVRAQQSMQHLAAAAQTPVGAMYSLPFQDTSMAAPFASRQGLWDLSYWGNFRSVVSHSIAVEQS